MELRRQYFNRIDAIWKILSSLLHKCKNKIFKTDEKLVIVVGTQALVLNNPGLEFNLSYLEAAKS